MDNPRTANSIVPSGNLMADFRFNVTAESQGRMQACRLYEMTDHRGVRDKLSFLIARDTAHHNQCLATIEELKKDGLGETPVPATFPQDREFQQMSYQFWNLSEGTGSQEGRWASGPSIDGKGRFEYLADPQPLGKAVEELGQVDPRVYGRPKQPTPPTSSFLPPLMHRRAGVLRGSNPSLLTALTTSSE